MCNILNVSIKTGKSKELQLNELSRYCLYSKDKNKYIIDEIFINPLPKIDHRKEGNNSKYVEHVKFLLLQKLSTCEGYTCTFTKNNLFEFLGMINPLYLDKVIARKIITKNDSRINNFDINHFYMRANDKMTRILFDSLNSLKNQYLISYKEVDIIVRLNIEGEKEFTEATKEETKLIMDIKREVLKDMELNSMMQVIFKFKTEEFYSKVSKILKEEYEIEYTYKQFELIFTKENILDELAMLELKKHKKELNNKVCDIVNLNAKNTYNKNLEKYEKELEDFLLNEKPALGSYTESNFKGFCFRSEYIDIQLELTEYLLRID